MRKPQRLPDVEREERPVGITTYFFREAFRRLWVYKRTSGVAVGMIAIALLILGTFLLIAENIQVAVDRWQGKSQITIYLEPDLDPARMTAIAKFLASKPEYAKYRFVSREEALARFKQYFVNLSHVVSDLEENPFPASYEVEVSREIIQRPDFARKVGEIRTLPGVDDVQFDWQWVARLRRLANILNIIGIFAGGILAVAAAFTIANVIRLTMVLYKEEIDIMRLVGATEKIIRGPFLLEGLLQGMLGGVFAVATLFGVFKLARYLIGPSSALLWDFLFVTFLPWYKTLALIGGGIAAGLIGSWLSLRENRDERVVVKA